MDPLITAHRFRKRGLHGMIMDPDMMITRPLARFLLSEGLSSAAAAESEWECDYELLEPDGRGAFESEGTFMSSAFAYRATKKRIQKD